MSIAIMAEVFASDLPTARRFVLLALADNAQDDTDEAWPSVATICGKTGLGESTVQRHLGALVTEDGLLSRAWRENDSTVYRINRKALRARARARVQTRQTGPAGDVEYEPEGSRSEGGPAAGPVPDRDPGGPAATTRGSRSGTLITREPPGNPSPSGGRPLTRRPASRPPSASTSSRPPSRARASAPSPRARRPSSRPTSRRTRPRTASAPSVGTSARSAGTRGRCCATASRPPSWPRLRARWAVTVGGTTLLVRWR